MYQTREISNRSLTEEYLAQSSTLKEVTLPALITRLERDYQIHQAIRNTKYPRCLIKSLRQLDQIYGMANLKNNIARQTWYLINREQNQDLPMLNTLLFGAPGTGKTTVATIVAKIWASVGVLDSNISHMEKVFIKNQLKTSTQRSSFIVSTTLTFLLSVAMLITKMFQIFEVVGKYIWYIVAGIALFFVGLYIYSQSYSEESYMKAWENDKIKDIDASNVITTLGREDLVASYVGQTANKTATVLGQNIGKVIFVDEAYSLYQGPNDSYGIEALTVITQFLTEHKGKILLIFAGYEDKITQQLFVAQPGLPRRFTWHFRVDEYTHDDLFRIFKKQLRGIGVTMDTEDDAGNEDECHEIIRENFHKFPHYGGDTERLITHIDFVLNECRMFNDDFDNGLLTPLVLVIALDRFTKAS